MPNYIGLTDFQNEWPQLYGQISNLYTETTLSGLISKASRKVDSIIGYPLYRQTVTNEKAEAKIDNQGNVIIFPKHAPVISVTSIQLVWGTENANLVLTDANGNNHYDIEETYDGLHPRIIWQAGQAGLSSGTTILSNLWNLREFSNIFTKISYVAGFESVPDDIKEATVLLMSDILAARSNPLGAKKVQQGAISISYSERNGKSDLVEDAESLLQKYKKVV